MLSFEPDDDEDGPDEAACAEASGRCSLDAGSYDAPALKGSRSGPDRLSPDDVSFGTGRAYEGEAIHAWTLRSSQDLEALVADISSEPDEEWLEPAMRWLGDLVWPSDGMVCVAAGKTPGKADGFVLMNRELFLSGTSDEPTALYGLYLKGVFLAPSARGSGLSGALEIAAVELFGQDLTRIAAGLGSKSHLTIVPSVHGEAESSAGAAWMSRTFDLIEERMQELEGDHPGVEFDELSNDLDTLVFEDGFAP